MAQPPIISIRDLHKHYRDGQGGDLHILKGVNLEVKQGETVSIMGASGAGKSTLLHMVGALDNVDQGVIEVKGVDVSALPAEEAAAFRNATIGFVFQFHHLLMDFSALENVMMPMWIREGSTRPFEKEAEELLDRVGIRHRMNHRPAQLSGGEQQRLAIARAIANKPKVLLADEPTGNLDEATGEKIAELLLELNRSDNLTLVMVTHNQQLARSMQTSCMLEHGQLVSSTNGSAE